MKPHLIYLLLALSLALSAPVRASRPDTLHTDSVHLVLQRWERARCTYDTIQQRLSISHNDTVRQNLIDCDINEEYIRIRLINATERDIDMFRRTVMDSPLFIFEGLDTTDENPVCAPTDTLGVSLRVLTSVLPLSADSLTFELVNRSGSTVFVNQRGFLTYEDPEGVWRNYPGSEENRTTDYELPPAYVHTLTADLFPLANRHRPTRFRYFHRVDIGPHQDILLMCEFRLADVPTPTLLSPTVESGLTRSDAWTEAVKVYGITDKMPEYPDGYKAMMKFLNDRESLRGDIQKTVIVQFVVEPDGSLANVKVCKPYDRFMDEHAESIVRSMPRWIPGRYEGRPARILYLVPIRYRLW